MSFIDYMQGLEVISIKLTPLIKDRSLNPPQLIPYSERTELRDSNYLPDCMKRAIYSEIQRLRDRSLGTII